MLSLKPEGGQDSQDTQANSVRRWIPPGILARIDAMPHFRKASANFGWLFADKIIRMVGGILLTVFLARYLGTDGFGTFNYAVAFVALFTPIASLGLNEVVVRDLVRDREASGQILGTAAALVLIGGILAFALCLLSYFLFGTTSTVDSTLIAILSTTLLLKASDVIKYWFQSHTASRPTVWLESSVFVVFCTLKLAMILLQAPLIAFIAAMVAEAIASAIGLVLLYIIKNGVDRRWCFNSSRASKLLADSMPIILSGGLVLLSMNIDKVMLGRMSGVTEVGLYSAASRLTEAWYFLPVIAGASIAPRLTELFVRNRAAYVRITQSTFNMLTVAALLACFIATMFSRTVVEMLYGEHFSAAAPMLVVHVWTALFVFHVSLRTQLLVIERRQMLILAFSFLTLCANVAINLFAIPIAGGLGASYASLVSWAMCVLVFPLVFKASRCYPMQFFFRSPRYACKHV